MLCVHAWHELSTCRGIGMAMGPIPWTAIVTWCEFHSDELDRDAAVQLIHVIRQLDNDRAEREAAKQALAKMTGGQQ
jgi:hypothetical protein